jgi:riboflavin biosynthesis pyrimidine reductase
MTSQLKLVSDNSDFKTILATSIEPTKEKTVTNGIGDLIFWSVKETKKGQIDLGDLLQKAKAFGVYSIMVEGGAELVTSLLNASLIDKLILITAPIILGNGINTVGDLKIRKVRDGLKFKDYYRFPSGVDEIFVGYPDWR